MIQQIRHFYEFGSFRLDTNDRILLRNGEHVPLPPKAALGLIAGLSVFGAVLLMLVRPTASRPSYPPLRIVPFTSFPGTETQPAFSPAGDQIAFVWGGEKGDNLDIYVKGNGPGQPRRLTSDSSPDTHPAWSPDGRYIAFLRESADRSAFYIVPVVGGLESKVADVDPRWSGAIGSSQYYSTDGRFLAVPDKGSQDAPSSIFLLSVETGEKHQLTSPPAGSVGDSYPAFSPDGKLLAFTRSVGQGTTDLYVVSLVGGEPTRLTFDNASIVGEAWTSDSSEIVFASRRGGSAHNLWRIPATGGKPARLSATPQGALSPAISIEGSRLAYTQILNDQNIWRLPLDSNGGAGTPTSLIASTLSDNGPDYSPDGKRIVFASNRSGDFGIWTCDRDGLEPRLLFNGGPYLTGTPRWSPEGDWIAFDSRLNNSNAGGEGNADIYVIRADGTGLRRLTDEPSEDVAPSWSRDGRWIYFASTRSGRMQVWGIPFEGGEAVQVTRRGGFEGFESTDGRTFYYARRFGAGIWQVPVTGGQETLVFDHNRAGYWRLWTVVEKGIYFATATNPSRPVIEFFDFATRTVRQVATLDKPLSRTEPGLACSPDGRSLLFTQADQSGSDIMLGEEFH